MFCFNCGKEIDGQSLFCPACGAKQEQEESFPVEQEIEQRGKKKSGKKGIIITLSILGVLLIGGGVFAYTQLEGVTAPTTVNESAKINKNPIHYNYAICGVFDLQGNSDYSRYRETYFVILSARTRRSIC